MLVSGCIQANNKDNIDQTDESQKDNTAGPKIGKPIGKQTNQIISGDTIPPLISETIVSPNNPSLNDAFKISVVAEDESGISQLSWQSSKPLLEGESGSSECDNQPSCSNSWEFTALEEGQVQITVTAIDSSGEQSERVLEASVGPARKKSTSTSTDTPSTASFTCGNSICEGGESYLNCENDCETSKTVGTSPADGACEPGESVENAPKDCTTIDPNCGNGVCDSDETRFTCYADCQEESSDDSCSGNSDCGYKQRCRSGKCQSVQCTTDSQCGYNKRCSDYVCRTNYI